MQGWSILLLAAPLRIRLLRGSQVCLAVHQAVAHSDLPGCAPQLVPACSLPVLSLSCKHLLGNEVDFHMQAAAVGCCLLSRCEFAC